MHEESLKIGNLGVVLSVYHEGGEGEEGEDGVIVDVVV